MSTAKEALQPSFELCMTHLGFHLGITAKAAAFTSLYAWCPAARACQGLRGFLRPGHSVLERGQFWAIGGLLVTPPKAVTLPSFQRLCSLLPDDSSLLTLKPPFYFLGPPPPPQPEAKTWAGCACLGILNVSYHRSWNWAFPFPCVQSLWGHKALQTKLLPGVCRVLPERLVQVCSSSHFSIQPHHAYKMHSISLG